MRAGIRKAPAEQSDQESIRIRCSDSCLNPNQLPPLTALYYLCQSLFLCFPFCMSKTLLRALLVPFGMLLAAATLAAQAQPTAAARALSVERAIDLAAQGRCQEALPQLKVAMAKPLDKQLEHRTATATRRWSSSRT